MDLFGRYIFRQAGGTFCLILLTLTAIVWLAVGLGQLDVLTAKGQSFMLFLKMTSLTLPGIMAMITPVGFLVACLYTLDRLNGDSELVVMNASGAPIWRFGAPLLALASLVSVVLLVFNLYLLPLSLRTLSSYVTQIRTDLITQVLQPGRFSTPEKKLTFHIRDRDANGDLLGLIVHDERTKGRAMTYLADRGRIVKNGDKSYLVMMDGQIHRRLDGEKREPTEVKIGEFRQYIYDITELGGKAGPSYLKPSQRYLPELYNPDKDDPFFKHQPGKFRSEIHERFASLLYPIVFALITLNFLGHPRTIRESRWKSIVAAFGMCVVVKIGGLAATNLLTLQAWAVALVYGIPIGAILVAAAAAHVRMAAYARFRLGLELPAKLQFYNKISGIVSGVKTERTHGRVG